MRIQKEDKWTIFRLNLFMENPVYNNSITLYSLKGTLNLYLRGTTIFSKYITIAMLMDSEWKCWVKTNHRFGHSLKKPIGWWFILGIYNSATNWQPWGRNAKPQPLQPIVRIRTKKYAEIIVVWAGQQYRNGELGKNYLLMTLWTLKYKSLFVGNV